MQADSSIHVRELSYAYPGGAPVLEHISFAIAAGESVGLVGPNGAGKTSLFLCLCGVLQTRAGMVAIAGVDPAVPEQRRLLPSRTGIVFQNSDDQLFSTTVFDDVAFGPLNLGLPAREIEQRVAQSLERVGLKGFDKRVPFHLSGGEKRRTALAGVLAMQPGVLLLDEPSMYLDPRGRRELIRLINGLAVTKVIAGHDLEMIRETCARVFVLDAGRLVADGPTRQVLADAQLMNAHGLEVPHSLTPHRDQQQHHDH